MLQHCVHAACLRVAAVAAVGQRLAVWFAGWLVCLFSFFLFVILTLLSMPDRLLDKKVITETDHVFSLDFLSQVENPFCVGLCSFDKLAVAYAEFVIIQSKTELFLLLSNRKASRGTCVGTCSFSIPNGFFSSVPTKLVQPLRSSLQQILYLEPGKLK